MYMHYVVLCVDVLLVLITERFFSVPSSGNIRAFVTTALIEVLFYAGVKYCIHWCYWIVWISMMLMLKSVVGD